MQKKLTITIDEKVYEGLHSVIGRRKISQFIETLVKPHVVEKNLDAEYERMSKDTEREQEALLWVEGIIGDIANETR